MEQKSPSHSSTNNQTLETVIDEDLNNVKLSSKDIRHLRKKAKLLHVVEGSLQSTLNGSLEKRIDFVVVFTPRKNEATKPKDVQEQRRIDTLREKFKETCAQEGWLLTECFLPNTVCETSIVVH